MLSFNKYQRTVKISRKDEPKKERKINTKDIIGMNNYFDPLI